MPSRFVKDYAIVDMYSQDNIDYHQQASKVFTIQLQVYLCVYLYFLQTLFTTGIYQLFQSFHRQYYSEISLKLYHITRTGSIRTCTCYCSCAVKLLSVAVNGFFQSCLKFKLIICFQYFLFRFKISWPSFIGTEIYLEVHYCCVDNWALLVYTYK